MTSKHITIKLGIGLRQPWAMPPETGEVIGTVRVGQAFGFLVRQPDGAYVQVNGAQTRPLSPYRVHLALRSALGAQRAREAIAAVAQAQAASTRAVVVVKKKRRVLALENIAA